MTRRADGRGGRAKVPAPGGPRSRRRGGAEGWRPLLPLAALLALALAVRLARIGYDLPDFLDEAIPFRKALEMWTLGGPDWNPRLFHYPSLTVYLNLLLQHAQLALGQARGAYAGIADYQLAFDTDPTPMVLLARSANAAADLLTVGCAWRIGERLRPGAGLLAGFLVACAPTMFRASLGLYSDSVTAALAMLALERMLAYRAQGGRARLLAAAALCGLAAGAKYPAAALVLVLGVAVWQRSGWRGLRAWGLALAVAIATFLATTPFAVLDFATFVRDLGIVRQIGAEGPFGGAGARGFGYALRALVRDLGWAAPALLVVSAAMLLAEARAAGPGRVERRDPRVVLWAAFLAFAVPVAVARVQAERYLAPVLPLVALLAADAALVLAGSIAARLRRGRAGRVSWLPRLTAPVVALVLAVPAVVAAARALPALGSSTRVEARRWIERNVGPGDLVVQELHAAPVLPRLEYALVQAGPAFEHASPPARDRYRARRWYPVVTVPLTVLGDPTVALRDTAGAPARVRVVRDVADLNDACYDPRLYQGADYVVTSSVVRGRFAADPRGHAAPVSLYALLDSTAEVAARFRSAPGDDDAEVVIYRIGARARAALAAAGPLDPLWWAEFVSPGARASVERALPAARRTGGRTRDAAGEPAAWVTALAELFAARYETFVRDLAIETIERRRPDLAFPLAEALVSVRPTDLQACLMLVESGRQIGAWERTRAIVERSLVALQAAGAPADVLLLEYGELLARAGETARARETLMRLAEASDPEIAREARRRLQETAGN